jgi:23S rRNA (pseudouridine1915-N3)-methyltransferase
MAISILAVGKKHESWVVEGIERYQKRLRAPFTAEWVLIPHSSLQGLQARQEESERILSRLKPTDFVILLDERGKEFASPALAELLENELSHSASIVFIIGGAFGVDQTIHERAQKIWSLSPLVFPHQLVRLIITEQLYRVQQITTGGSYHHE